MIAQLFGGGFGGLNGRDIAVIAWIEWHAYRLQGGDQPAHELESGHIVVFVRGAGHLVATLGPAGNQFGKNRIAQATEQKREVLVFYDGLGGLGNGRVHRHDHVWPHGFEYGQQLADECWVEGDILLDIANILSFHIPGFGHAVLEPIYLRLQSWMRPVERKCDEKRFLLGMADGCKQANAQQHKCSKHWPKEL